jgi:hypothetical protein
MPMTFRGVCAIGLRLPGVEQGTMYGTPALKLGKRLIACIASNKQAEPGTLAVRTDFEQRDMLIEEAPDIYYVKEHYQNYPVVLVRLSRIDPDAMRDLLGAAHRFVSEAENAKKTKRRRGRRPASIVDV